MHGTGQIVGDKNKLDRCSPSPDVIGILAWKTPKIKNKKISTNKTGIE